MIIMTEEISRSVNLTNTIVTIIISARDTILLHIRFEAVCSNAICNLDLVEIALIGFSVEMYKNFIRQN